MSNFIDKKLIDKNVILVFVAFILITSYGIFSFVMPLVGKINEKKSKIVEVQAEVQTLKNQIVQASPPVDHSQKLNLPVSVYESPYKGMDLENASVDLVDGLIQVLKLTKNKVSELSFTSSNVGSVGVLSLNMSLSGNYISLQNLLQKISTWRYLAGIKNIEIEQQGNPDNLSAKLTLDLYIKN